MNSFKEIEKCFIRSMSLECKEDYGKALTLITGLWLIGCEKYRRKLQQHRRFLSNLTSYYYVKCQREKKSLMVAVPERRIKSWSLLNVLNINEVEETLRIPIVVFYKILSKFNIGNISELDLAIYLMWLSKACNYEDTATENKLCRLPVNDVVEIVNKTITALLDLIPCVVKFPETALALQEIGNNFAALAGHTAFASVVGCIDTWHLNIEETYQSNKEYMITKNAKSDDIFLEVVTNSLHLQGVCDHQGLFLDICVGLSKTTNNVEILRSSPIYCQQLYPPKDFIIVGNHSLPCIEFPITILTPYPVPMHSARDAQYNGYHKRLQAVSEKAFYKMYSRWIELFSNPMRVSDELATQVVATCTVIHNLCVSEEDYDELNTSSGSLVQSLTISSENMDCEENEVDSEDIRNNIAQELPSPLIVPLHLQSVDMT